MSTGDPTGPFPPSPLKIPTHGDPEILPRGTVVRPSAERLPFGPSGELLPDGPALPADFLLAPDLAKFPQWSRRRGDEWTDLAVRTQVRAWLVVLLRARPWARSWDVAERATTERFSGRLPPGEHYLRVGLTDREQRRVEAAARFPDRTPAGVALSLSRLEVGLDAARAAL